MNRSNTAIRLHRLFTASLLCLAFCSSLAFSQEIRRPGTETLNVANSCSGTQASQATAMPNFYAKPSHNW